MKKYEYVRPLLEVTTVVVECGFGKSGSEEEIGGNEDLGGETPEYDYEDDEWD